MKTIITAIVACLGLAGTAAADTIYVAQDGTGDYDNINEAINNSSGGDMILVKPGTYSQAIKVNVNHDLIIESTDGPEVTIIDGNYMFDDGLIVNNDYNFEVRGLQFIRWGRTDDENYEAIRIGPVSSGSVLIEGCLVRKCASRPSEGSDYVVIIEATDDASVQLLDCSIEGNPGRGIYLRGEGASAIGCKVAGNALFYQSSNVGLGVRVEDHATVRGCLITDNVYRHTSGDLGYSMGIYVATTAYLYDNIICGNYVIRAGTTYHTSQIWGAWVGSGNQITEQCDFGDPPLGACCLETDCVEVDAYSCSVAGGNYLGALTTCGQVDCSNEGNLGACCIGGQCSPSNEYTCLNLGGEWSGAYTTCDDVACTPPPAIAGCCLSDECLTTTEELCVTLGGAWQDEASCADSECAAWTGACCVGSSCLDVTQAACFKAQGIFAGELTTCGDTTCPSVCSGDVNLDNTVDVNDILLLIANYGPCP